MKLMALFFCVSLSALAQNTSPTKPIEGYKYNIDNVEIVDPPSSPQAILTKSSSNSLQLYTAMKNSLRSEELQKAVEAYHMEAKSTHQNPELIGAARESVLILLRSNEEYGGLFNENIPESGKSLDTFMLLLTMVHENLKSSHLAANGDYASCEENLLKTYGNLLKEVTIGTPEQGSKTGQNAVKD